MEDPTRAMEDRTKAVEDHAKAMEYAIKRFEDAGIIVLAPGSPGYEHSIATANRFYRFSRPRCVVQPMTAADVAIIVEEAKKRGLDLTIKCNGHSYAGHSTAFKDISLDLRRMDWAKLNADNTVVTVGAGAQWGDVYRKLVDGQEKLDGLIVVGGRCPDVGVAGFILGGGLGPFTRGLGMGSDALIEASIVTAKAELKVVSEKDDPTSNEGRLFWALRGAGGGNFGVVTELKLRVQRLRDPNGWVTGGRYQWFPDGGITDAVMATMNEFYATEWPNSMTIDSTWICDLRQSQLGGVRFTIAFDGRKREYDALIDKHIKDVELAKQLKRRALEEKSTRFLYETLVNQWLEEQERAYPENKTYELFSSFVFTFDPPKPPETGTAVADDAPKIPKVTAEIKKLMKTFRCKFSEDQVNFLVTWIHSGGRASEKAPTDTAFFWRAATWHAYVTVEWADKWMESEMRGFLKEAKDALRPYSLNREAAFINFPDRDFPDAFYERAYFGGNRDELRLVKQIWDPERFFKFSQALRPPGASEDEPEANDGVGLTDRLAREQWESFKPPPVVKDYDRY